MISSSIWLCLLAHFMVSVICLIGGLGMIRRYGYKGFLLAGGLILFCLVWSPLIGAPGGW